MKPTDKEIEAAARVMWNVVDSDGYFILAGKQGIKTFHPKWLAKAALEAAYRVREEGVYTEWRDIPFIYPQPKAQD